ncbi:MAG: lipid-binding SYLF domain-containing protein [Acidobacteriaceae bacterium]
MKKVLVMVCLLAMTSMLDTAYAADNAKLIGRLEAAKTTLDQVMMTPDKGIPQQILQSAVCVAVVPGFKKAAFIFGAQYGQGVATCKTNHGWSAPVFIQMTGGSFGFQIGGQSTDFVMVAVNDKGMQDMLKNKFKIGGDAAASAGPVGRNAAAGTDWKMNAELLTYSRSKGLFAGIDLDGTVVSQNSEDTKSFYGSDIPFDTILKGNVVTPQAARPFVRAVAKYFVESKRAQ